MDHLMPISRTKTRNITHCNSEGGIKTWFPVRFVACIFIVLLNHTLTLGCKHGKVDQKNAPVY